jgi:hypothetical protein
MRELRTRLDTFRRELIQTGLIATCNLVHDQHCTDADVAELWNFTGASTNPWCGLTSGMTCSRPV